MFHNDFFRSVKEYKINAVIKVLIISDFVIASSANLFSPIFAIFVLDKIGQSSFETVGIAVGIKIFFEAILEIPIARKIDKTKTEKDDFYVTVMGTSLAGLAYFAFIFVDSVSGLYVVQAVLGISSAMVFPGWFKIFTRHSNKEKAGIDWSFYDVFVGVGKALTAFWGAIIVLKLGYELLFVLIAFLTFLGALLLLSIRKKIK